MTFTQKIWLVIIIVLLSSAFYIWWRGEEGIKYINNEYGFSVSLPDSWAGYAVDVDKWSGYKPDDQLGEVAYASGPVFSIHHPKWTAENMRQDIPVMVFSLSEWQELSAKKFHIGAAPVGPSELARNDKYVFALPARYNYAFPPGHEEVESILKLKPVEAF